MIPKIIHYCWFGGNEKSKLIKKCIASWKKYCPDYEIIEWNENNFDVNQCEYTKFAASHNLYAYLSDYVRLKAVYEYGGIYLDTDVELIKSLDKLLDNEAFIGFETPDYVTTGLGFGGEKHSKAVGMMLSEYDDMNPDVFKEKYEKQGHLTGSPTMNTNALLPLGLKRNGESQSLQGCQVYSSDYFCPFDDYSGILTCTENTYSIHWYGKSPHGKYAYYRSKLSRIYHRILMRIKR